VSADPTIDLLSRYRQGDEAAATELYRRYVEQLAAVARGQLSSKIAARLDPEDVVQSAYRSFFIRAREGEYVLQRGGDLWRLLVGIVRNKALAQVERHTAARRTFRREERFDHAGAPLAELAALAHEPSPEEASVASELLVEIMAELTPAQRQVLELRLQGFTLDEIAAATGRCERTVRRWLESIKSLFAARLAAGEESTGPAA
jgi:RNA polymerase sigma factor (sigma-70 family)